MRTIFFLHFDKFIQISGICVTPYMNAISEVWIGKGVV